MHTGAFVPLRDVGKLVGSLYLKNSKDIHGRIVPPRIKVRNS
jgi:hypothetical protein